MRFIVSPEIEETGDGIRLSEKLTIETALPAAKTRIAIQLGSATEHIIGARRIAGIGLSSQMGPSPPLAGPSVVHLAPAALGGEPFV